MSTPLRHPRDLLRIAVVKLAARGETLQAGAEVDFTAELAAVHGDAAATTRLNVLLGRAAQNYRWLQASPSATSETYVLTELGEQEARVLEGFNKALANVAAHYRSRLDVADRSFTRQFMNEQESLGIRGLSQSSGARATAQRSLDAELEQRRQLAEELLLAIGSRLRRTPEEAEYERLFEVADALVRKAVASLEPLRVAYNKRHEQYPHYQLAPLAESPAVEATRAALTVAAFPQEPAPPTLHSTHQTVSVGGSVGAVVQGSGNQMQIEMTVDNRQIYENLSAILEALGPILASSPDIAEVHAELVEASQLDAAKPLPKKMLIRSYRALAGLLAVGANTATVVEGTPRVLALVKAGLALLGFPVG